MVELTVELNLETQDSSKVPGKESIVPDNSDIKLENKILNFSSMIKGVSSHISFFTLLRKYSFRELSEKLIREVFPDFAFIEGCLGEVGLEGAFGCRDHLWSCGVAYGS
jgi:hypothetical protein